MDRGYSHEEKIKILYEDSLIDIRELTGRAEALVATIAAIEASVDRQKQGELSALVRMEIARAGDIQTARNEALGWGIKWATAGVIVCFVAGFFSGYWFEYERNTLLIKDAETRVANAWEKVNEVKKNMTWVDTDEGKAAYHFYTTSWPLFANCSGGSMEKVGENGCRMVQKFWWFGGNENPAWYTGPATK